MRERHALWSSIAAKRGVIADTESKREALHNWNVVTICERFGWTPEYVGNLSQSFMDDIVEICNIRDHYSNKSSSS